MSDSRFSDVLLDEIRLKAPLIEIATEFWGEPNKGASHKLGARWGGQGSRHVDMQAHLWHDYEDGIHADVFELVMKESGRSFPEAVEFAAQRAGVALPDRPATASQPPHEARPSAPAPEVLTEREGPPADAPEAVRVHVKGYRYTDGDGNVLYEVIRDHFKLPDGSFVRGKTGNPKKTFWQRRPDGRGGYITGLGDVAHTIYRRQAVEIAIAEGKTIFLPEGEKDVETIEEWGLVGSTNSGGAQNWSPALAAMFAGADVVILGDDDEAGHKRVETIGLSLRGIAKRIRAIGSWGGPKDVTDWKEVGHTASELGEILNTLPDWRPSPPASSMGAVGVDQLHHPSLKHDFLIADFLDRQGVAMMPGASGSGKTFVILEMGMCAAMGRDFMGMKVLPGVVLYQAGEGKQGVAKRLDAWMMDRGVTPDPSIPFQMLTRRVNLFNDDKDTDDLIEEGKRWAAYYGQPIRMVVIDTFNKAITGANENAGQDMTKVLSRLERISVQLDCAVIAPIHKSKEGTMRGHTSLTGDVSNVINVTELQMRDHNGRIVRSVTLDKNKDGEKGKPLRFVLRQVVLDVQEDGKAVTTCVIDKPDGDEEEYGRQGKLSLNQILALKALRQAVEDHGEQAPNGIRAGSAVRTVVKNASWKERFIKSFPPLAEVAADKREAEAKRLLQHAGKVLLAGDYIGVDNELGITWLTGKDDRPKREPKPVEKAKPSPLMTDEDREVPF